MNFLEILTYTAIIAFSLRGIIFVFGAYRERQNINHKTIETFPSVSVVVPARNEQTNIKNCLHSVYKNKYPHDKFEIIAVNDRSTDDTLEILEKLKEEIPNLKIVNIKSEADKDNLQGKPGALQAGINVAQGDIILMTDADCIVDEKWIRTLVSQYTSENIGLVASFTNVTGNKIFDRIQAIEWTYLHTMACAGIGLNQPLGCYGNNLSIRKKVFDQIGGYKKIKFSVTEDLALLQTVHRAGYKIHYLIHENADVDTYACSTVREYLKQRHRWAVGGLDLGWRAAIFIISSAFLILGIISSIFLWNPLDLVLIVLTRMFWDYLLIGSSFNILNKKELKKWIPLGVLFFIIEEVIVPFLLLKPKVNWKGQTFKRI